LDKHKIWVSPPRIRPNYGAVLKEDKCFLEDREGSSDPSFLSFGGWDSFEGLESEALIDARSIVAFPLPILSPPRDGSLVELLSLFPSPENQAESDSRALEQLVGELSRTRKDFPFAHNPLGSSQLG